MQIGRDMRDEESLSGNLTESLERNREHIESLIDDAYASGPFTPLTPEDFAAARRRLEQRIADSKAK